MKYNKLVVISTDPLNSRIAALFGIHELSKKIPVEYWDVSSITYPNTSKEHVAIDGVSEITIQSRRQFVEEVKRLLDGDVLAMVYMNFAKATFYCYRILSKYRIDLSYCVNGVLPLPNGKTSRRKRWLNMSYRRMSSWVVRHLKGLPLFRALKYQFNTCLNAHAGYKVGNETHYIPFNCTDRQLLIGSYDSAPIINNERYIVFLDQNYAYHPDYDVLGKKPVNPHKYFEQMNELFDKLEDKYKCKVVIAAHPSADQYARINPFNGRLCIRDKTALLVRESIGVVAHYSTSISYAILTRKPLLFVTSIDMNLTVPLFDSMTELLASMLDCRQINLDHYTEFKFAKVNNQAYESYEANYLKHPDLNNENNGDILYNVLSGKYE